MSHRAAIYVLLVSLTLLTACGRIVKKEFDPLTGKFKGTFVPQSGQSREAEAWVIADETKYRVAIVVAGTADAPALRIEVLGQRGNDQVLLVDRNWEGKSPDVLLTGTVTKDTVRAEIEGAKGGKFELKRVEQKSPTLGEKPPAGAVVLLPFEQGQPTNLDRWTNKEWVCEQDGSIQVYRGDNRTKREFGSFKLHLEFYVPFLPALPGGSRGKSGVFLHNRYEIEIADSFGLPPDDRSCGALAGLRAPLVDASLPPGQWQAFDIDFEAPQFDPVNGEQSRPVIITVLLNGVKVHDAVGVVDTTAGALGLPAKTGALRLQDHNHPVRFRNIWLVEKK
jgi:hypothetical protein